jgi:hypothetical protein
MLLMVSRVSFNCQIHPGSGKNLYWIWIPDPGGKKAPDPVPQHWSVLTKLTFFTYTGTVGIAYFYYGTSTGTGT